jgi:WXG100 family type VII secretion target
MSSSGGSGGGELIARVGQMRDAASDIGDGANRINEAVDAVDAEIRALGPDRFISTAAEAFRSEYNRLTTQLREAHDSLLNFRDKLLESAEEIEAAARPS